MSKNVMVAMSGGVDSSVVACLLHEKGYNVTGATLKLFDSEDVGMSAEDACCSESNIEDARKIATQLGIPYYVYNFAGDFREEVIARFIHAYEIGATPNPCIDCNRHIKFEKLFVKGEEMGQQYVATGHYARIEEDKASGRFLLKKGLDPKKDQSYVLYSLSQHQLAHTLFPLGEMPKTETRRLAEKYQLLNANKKDSQDICFAPDGDYAGFIRRQTGTSYPPGNFVDLNGNVLGEHKGIIHYTIGQRKGLGLALPHPMYVMKKDVASNEVILSEEEHLFTTSLDIDDVNWIAYENPQESLRLAVKIRYSQKEYPATVTPTGPASAHIEFDSPQRAITPGQAAVMYDGDVVVGGGTIL